MTRPSTDPKPNPFAGKKVIFATTADPSPLNQYGGPGIVVAVMPGTSAAQVAALRATGADVAYWDPEVTTQSIANAKALGITTVIGQVEGPYQLDNYNAAYAAKDPNMTVGTVTSNGSAYYTPNADFMMVEADEGEVAGQTVDNAMGNAYAVKPTMPVIPVIYGSTGSATTSPTDQANSAAKYGGYGIFPPGPESPEIKTMLGPSLSGGGSTGGSQSAVGQQHPQTKKPHIPTHNEGPTSENSKPDDDTPIGIHGPHQQAGADGAPKAYHGGAPIVDDPKNPNDTYSFTDKKHRRVTITTTASGAKIEQVEGETPYQIKAPDKPAEDPSKPAWHQNANWGAPNTAAAAAAGLNSSQVLEQRPGANGNTIYRMADGSYKSVSASGGVSDAGTWNNAQWNDSQHGQVNVDAINNGSPAATDASSSGGYNLPKDPNDIPPPVGGLPGDPNSHGGQL